MPRTILVADDSTTIRKIVELSLSDSDLRVESAESGAEAMEILNRAEPDLVLADVVMPSPDGYEICRIVKRSARPVPVLLLTGAFEPFDAELARDCGADGHLVKPFESRALRSRVERLLAGTEEPEPLAEDERPGLSGPVPDAAGAAAEGAALGASEADSGIDDGDPSADEPEAARTVAVAAASDPTASAELIDAVARAVVERLSERVVREVAWEVVPELAAKIIRERIRELEGEETEGD